MNCKKLAAILLQSFSLVAAITLVLHDGSVDFDEYKLFFQDFAKIDKTLVFKDVKTEKSIPIVSSLDSSQNLYDNLIVFPITGRGLGKKLTSADLLKFTSNTNGNMFVINNVKSASDEVRLFLNQLGVYPSPKDYQLYDHFTGESSEGHNLLSIPLQDNFLDTENIIVSETLKTDDILYSGSSAMISNNDLIIPVLSAPSTSFNYNPKKMDKKSTEQDSKYLNDFNHWGLGSQNYLIVAFQNLVNSRISWVGSSEFLSDKLYKDSNYKNEKIINDLLSWTFGKKNVLRIDHVEFYKTSDNTFNAKLTKDTFKVKDEVVYNIGISEYKDDQWQPYIADDVQLEFTMLDPYYRLNLQPIASSSPALSFNDNELSKAEPNGTYFLKDFAESGNCQYYSAKFNLPDQHGMFKYLVEYKKPGYSFLKSENIITLRNLAFDEYVKSSHIVNSWVYLSSIVTLAVGWVVFVILFLFGGNSPHRATLTKKNK